MSADIEAALRVLDHLAGQRANSSPRREYFRLTRREVEILLTLRGELKQMT